jgi:hypothetical protein
LREALAEITNIVNPQYYGAEIQEIAREALNIVLANFENGDY